MVRLVLSRRSSLGWAMAITLFGCAGGKDDGGDGFPTTDTSGAAEGADAGDAGSGDGDSGDGDASTGDGDASTGDGDGTSGDGDGDGVACTETPWAQSWIGDPCETDADCMFTDSVCLRESEGFPCGVCSQPCDSTCPDSTGAAVTFCVAGMDVGLPTGDGQCLSQCEPEIFGGMGCRDGYTCSLTERANDDGTVRGTCVPDAVAEPLTECMQDLLDLGLAFEPTYLPPESPATHPQLLCEVIEPVRLYAPIHDVSWRYISSSETSPLLVSCDMAKAIERMSGVIDAMGGDAFLHVGTYSCRVISGTDTLSEHSFAHAIDLGAFEMDGGETYTLVDDWEVDVPNPVTPGGQWLKTFSDTRFMDMVFNIILTPNYNTAHADHFHVDIKPGSSCYDCATVDPETVIEETG